MTDTEPPAGRDQERALAASDALYRQLAENLPDTSVMLFDNAVYWSDEAGGSWSRYAAQVRHQRV